MQITFRRQSYTQLWLVVTANEPLGILPGGGYIQDYFGNPSQITLKNVNTGSRQALLFTDTSSTSLSGYIPLNSIDDGTYRLEGYLQDLVENKTIIGEISDLGISGTATEVELTVIAAVGIGAVLNVSFQNQALNFKLVSVNNLVFADSVNIDIGIRSKFWYNVKFLPEVDPLLP